ncbi:MAG TPA: ketopantoate reductase family protein [Deltaproteobacteria bacterium]|nr:ketopantoate reductase family protein [Deltaproteobacteria bacterium]
MGPSPTAPDGGEDRAMNYLVMGAGALGSIFGGMLAKTGYPVTFVGMDDHLRTMQSHGLTITGLWGEHTMRKVSAYYGTQDLSGTYDVVLLCVKSYLTSAVIRQTLPFIRDDSLVISIQNGLGNWEAIAREIGWNRTIGARIIFGAEIESPGRARVTVYADKVLLGSPCRALPDKRLEQVSQELNASGIPTEITGDIEAALWAKVLYNCALNPLGAILNQPYGFLLTVDEIKFVLYRVICEIFDVARAKGVHLPYASSDEYFSVLVEKQLPPTATHRSSMLQDIEKGRPTEIDALNGAISIYGKELHVPTPTNDLIGAIIKGLEAKTR